MKLKFVGDVIVITLPGESTHRRSSLAKLVEKTMDTDKDADYLEHELLSVPAIALPLIEVNSKGATVSTREIKLRLTIVSREKELFSNKEIIVRYQAFEINLSGEQLLDVVLTSCIDVDRDTAKSFAENLVDNLYMQYDGTQYQINIHQ